MKFSELNLHQQLHAAIEKQTFDSCTEIQEKAIPHVLAGRDIAGLAQTGTGKTAAFLIPLMERIARARETAQLQTQSAELPEESVRGFPEWTSSHYVLILVPTRELASQVFDNVKIFGSELGMKAVAVYGGTSYEPQKKAIHGGVQFLVATPGRMIDLYKEHVIDLKQVRAIVFDEADRMFDMGFKEDMRYILQRVPKERQVLMFSATLNFDVLNVAYEFGADPVEINVSKDDAKAENVEDKIFHCGQDEKPRLILSLLKKYEPKQVIVFSNYKNNVERISQFLSQNDFPAVGISSLLTQGQRQRVMDQFKGENDRNIMVATDVAARGLDIKGVDLVVNFDLPDDPENYVHRIGRTGRANATGKAFSLVSDRDVEALGRIEDFVNHKLNVEWMDDKEMIVDFKEFPRENQRPRPPGGRNLKGDRSRGGARSSGGAPSPKHSVSDSGPRSARRPDRGESGTQQRRQNSYKGNDKSQGPVRDRGGDTKTLSPTQAGDGEARQQKTETTGKFQHRDRRLGRHRDGARHKSPGVTSNTPSSSATASARPQSPKKRPARQGQSISSQTSSKKRQYRHGSSAGTKSAPIQRTQSQSVGQKVSGFLKKIFS